MFLDIRTFESKKDSVGYFLRNRKSLKKIFFWLQKIEGRSRPTYVMSQKEKEALELEEMKMNQFHAKAVGETLPRSVGLGYLNKLYSK